MNDRIPLTHLFSALGTAGIAVTLLSSNVSALSSVTLKPQVQFAQTQTMRVALDLPRRSQPTLTQGGATRSASPNELKYTPSASLPKRNRPAIAGGAATRGSDPVIELIAPPDHTGATSSGHPVFFWFISAIPNTPVEFALRDEKADQTLLVKRVTITEAGLIKVELPKDSPALLSNKEYTWSVSFIHDAKEAEPNTTYKAYIQLQKLTSGQAGELAAAESPHERAIVYAQAGLWYDAIAQIASGYMANPQDASYQDDLLNLLSQVHLDQIVELTPPSQSSPKSSSTAPCPSTKPI